MRNKKSILVLILIAIIGIVGLTIAYFANSTDVENLFTTKKYGTTYTESFVSPDNWLPGDTTEKTIIVENTGEVDEAVRLSISQEWISHNGDSLDLSKNGVTAAVLNLANRKYWRYDNGYYYYKYKLAPGEVTSSFLESVTFNPDIELDDTCTETINNGTRTITCNSSGDDYDNATYTLTITIETVQYNKYASAWNTTFEIASEGPRPATDKVLTGVNGDTIDNYIDGNIHEMFTFSHSSTAQTGELTDYRYIGNDPYNYVYFNCSDEDDESTCEKWRIIGVFEVEDENGETVQRMKIVRDRLSTTYPWNSSYANDWNASSLKTYLNGDYYNSLSETAQNMIGTTKYYLGVVDPSVYSTEVLYNAERSTTTFSGRAAYWIGKIAIIYPSDQYFTYSNNVSTTCYELNCLCANANDPNCESLKSWIYLYNDTWVLNYYNNAWNNCLQFHIGDVQNANCSWPSSIKPTLYLKENIKIISGTGKVNDPYVLSD